MFACGPVIVPQWLHNCTRGLRYEPADARLRYTHHYRFIQIIKLFRFWQSVFFSRFGDCGGILDRRCTDLKIPVSF